MGDINCAPTPQGFYLCNSYIDLADSFFLCFRSFQFQNKLEQNSWPYAKRSGWFQKDFEVISSGWSNK